MSIHINELMDYLEAHPILCYDGSSQSLMEMLHDAYATYNFTDSAEIRGKFQEMRGLLGMLSNKDQDRFFNLVCDLCIEHEELAFSQGIVVGMHLMSELWRCRKRMQGGDMPPALR